MIASWYAVAASEVAIGVRPFATTVQGSAMAARSAVAAAWDGATAALLRAAVIGAVSELDCSVVSR